MSTVFVKFLNTPKDFCTWDMSYEWQSSSEDMFDEIDDCRASLLFPHLHMAHGKLGNQFKQHSPNVLAIPFQSEKIYCHHSRSHFDLDHFSKQWFHWFRFLNRPFLVGQHFLRFFLVAWCHQFPILLYLKSFGSSLPPMHASLLHFVTPCFDTQGKDFAIYEFIV